MMTTLLVNPKMDPALAARVVASVTGRRRQMAKVRSATRLVSRLRLVAALLVIGLVGSAVYSRHRDSVAFQAAKASLFAEWSAQARTLTESDQRFVERVSGLLQAEARDYAGEYTAEQLRPSGALASMLSRPALYVRGAIAGFLAPEGIARLAGESGKDSLLLCLFDPPAELAEKPMLPKARLALAGGPPVHELTPKVGRLADAVVGLPYLLPAWGERVAQAKDPAALQRLERELRKAPLEAAKRAVRAELLIAVYDEPNDAGGVTELDGEHAHSIRVVLFDLGSGKAILRLRNQVDPTWVTANRRSQYARELDGCKLAMQLRDAVAK